MAIAAQFGTNYNRKVSIRLVKLQTLLVQLIPNCTASHGITYTNLLQYFQTLVHPQSISQCRGSRISDSIPFKTVEESTPELVQVVLFTIVHYLKVTQT